MPIAHHAPYRGKPARSRQTIQFISSRVRETSMSSCQATRRSVGRVFRRSLLSGLFMASLAMLLCGPAGQAVAATYTFNGSVSTDWNNGANWTNVADLSTGVLPGAGDVVDVNVTDSAGAATPGEVDITAVLTNDTIA